MARVKQAMHVGKKPWNYPPPGFLDEHFLNTAAKIESYGGCVYRVFNFLDAYCVSHYENIDQEKILFSFSRTILGTGVV